MTFQGFSPDSFEQFIRALSLKVLGPGVTIFGNGPDGGREATFQGKVNYPFPPTDTWEGYGVIQAKFKETVEDTSKDQSWALKQLNAELERWRESEKRVPKPDYYIFCTNVALSSAQNGGRELLEKALENSRSTLGIRAYSIWDANQLKGYIDGYEQIRKRFSCFFTSGDLLAAFAKVLVRVPDPDAILTAYLCKEILADEDARLSQAGDRSEDRIRLAKVFMDLPVAASPSDEPPKEEDGRKLPPASLHALLRAASQKLDALTLYEQRLTSEREKDKSHYLCSRFVFLGGPGSGKSTIGQFLAQIHRAALLDRRPAHRLEYQVLSIIREIKARCTEEGANWPATPRYPFRIELNAFAKALAAGQKDGVATLSEYLRRSVSRDFALTHEDLRDWLRTFPWMLILDGLDEVPASSNRREVVAAIQNFLNEAKDVEADLMVVASSRPDGYAGEFDGDEVVQRYLLPLSKARALACAQRYVTAKVASKGDQRSTEAMVTLTNAIGNPLVARLMRSPLQVTFMVTVVAASGKPSESRWQLFNDYYRTIYERELHKAVPPFDQVLNERRQDIDALHHRVGFILQCRAESSGGTQSELTIAEFDKLVSACLEENGLSPADLTTQKNLILGAASQRLVFLTSRSPGRLSFDVRSLQEYMAAACITNADSSEIILRIETIAHSAYWRNTLLFAVGRFFVEPQMRAHRDKIRILCEDLNLKDIDRAAARLGSRLALEIIESGTIGNVPLVSRSLAECALGLLAIPFGDSDNVLSRLANLYDPVMEVEYQRATALWLGQKEISLSLSAWILVLYLERRRVLWAMQLVMQKWPKDVEIAFTVLRTWLSKRNPGVADRPGLQEIDSDRLRKLIPRISTEKASELLSLAGVRTAHKDSQWLSPLAVWWNTDDRIEAKLLFGDVPSGMTISLNPVPSLSDADGFVALKAMESESDLHPEWRVLLGLSDFFLKPSAQSLACSLEHIANSCEPSRWSFWALQLPWPIAICLASVSTKPDLVQLAELIRAAPPNQVDACMAKQVYWKEVGINLDDLCSPIFPHGPSVSPAIKRASMGTADKQIAESFVKALFQAILHAAVPEVKNTLAWIAVFYTMCSETWHCLDPQLLQQHLLPSRKHWWDMDFLVDPKTLDNSRDAWIVFYDNFGRLENMRFSFSRSRLHDVPIDFIWQAYSENRTRLGLLRLLGFWCASGIRLHAKGQPSITSENFSDPKLRLAAILIRMSQSDLTSDEAALIARQIPSVTVESAETRSLDIILTAIERPEKAAPALEVILTKLIEAIPLAEWQLKARAERLRNIFLQARPSGFDDRVLASLGLPLIEAQ